MLEILTDITKNAIEYVQMYGMWFGFSTVFLESFLPWLPLFVFIGLNITAFGSFWGYILSLVATIIGCLFSYSFFRWLLGKQVEKFINKNNRKRMKGIVEKIENINFTNLVLLMALPFSPAFLINIACGVSRVNLRKFFFSLLIGKPIIVYFWGFIGTSLIESITDVTTVILICILLIIAYLLSKIVVKKFNIE